MTSLNDIWGPVSQILAAFHWKLLAVGVGAFSLSLTNSLPLFASETSSFSQPPHHCATKPKPGLILEICTRPQTTESFLQIVKIKIIYVIVKKTTIINEIPKG